MSDDIMIFVESDEEVGAKGLGRRPDDDPKEARDRISRALDSVKWMAQKTREAMRAVPLLDAPDEVEIEFGVQIGAKAGVIVMQADSEFHFKVRLTWRKYPHALLEDDDDRRDEA
ncbi:MAG: CU044_2847 family protein [Anaerolineae bacterium]